MSQNDSFTTFEPKRRRIRTAYRKERKAALSLVIHLGQNKALAIEVFDALFNKRDHARAQCYRSDPIDRQVIPVGAAHVE